MEFRPLFGTQANIERQKEEQKRTVIDVVFHLIVLRETHEIALLHGGQIIHGCRTYAHHSYNICMCVCVCVYEGINLSCSFAIYQYIYIYIYMQYNLIMCVKNIFSWLWWPQCHTAGFPEYIL